MTISAIFKSALPSFSFFYKNGMTAVFINGRYVTDDEALIAELAAEIGAVGKGKSRHPYIYVDESEYEIDSEALTPIQIIKLQAKEEARAELLAEQAAAQATAMNAGANVSISKSESFAASLGNSNTIAQAGAAESTGPAVGVGISTGIADAVIASGLAAPATSMAASVGAKLANLSAPKN